MAANQVDSGYFERWKIVPAVTDVLRPQARHIHKPFPVRQCSPAQQAGQMNPSGQRKSAR